MARQEQEMGAEKRRQLLVKLEQVRAASLRVLLKALDRDFPSVSQEHIADSLLNEQVQWRRTKTQQRRDIMEQVRSEKKHTHTNQHGH